jgi:hypothetical protein
VERGLLCHTGLSLAGPERGLYSPHHVHCISSTWVAATVDGHCHLLRRWAFATNDVVCSVYHVYTSENGEYYIKLCYYYVVSPLYFPPQWLDFSLDWTKS